MCDFFGNDSVRHKPISSIGGVTCWHNMSSWGIVSPHPLYGDSIHINSIHMCVLENSVADPKAPVLVVGGRNS